MSHAADVIAPVFRPDITVATVVARDGRLLLVEERVRGELVLNQPAGHLEPDEGLIAAAVRETREESGWEVAITHLIGVYRWTAPDASHFLRFAFAGEALRHHPEQALDHGIERTLWMLPQEVRAARSRLRSPLVLEVINDWLAGARLPLTSLRDIA